MTRPILWATGTLLILAAAGSLAGNRIARQVPAEPRAADARAGAVPAAPFPGERLLVVNSDLRGHYMVHPTIDGQRVRMMVDTGASSVALTAADAAAAGYRPAAKDFTIRISTANGVVLGAPIRIRELRVGDITVRDVEGIVHQGPGLGVNLLGMSFLRRLKGFEISAGRLTMRG